MSDIETVVRIDPEEWADVSQLVTPFTLSDEAQDLGFVRLQNFQGRRRWVAATTPRMAVLDAGPWDQPVDVGLSARVISAALSLCEIGERPELILRPTHDGVPATVVVRGGGAEVELPAGPNRYPDIEALLAQPLAESHASVAVPAAVLEVLVSGAREMPAGARLEDDDPGPLFWIQVGDGALTITTNWGPYGTARYSVDAVVDGNAAVAVDPRFLHDFCRCLVRVAGQDAVTLHVPIDRGPAVLTADNWCGLLMPIETSVERFRPELEHMLLDLGIEPQADHDGDYPIPLPVGGMYVRLEGADARRHIPDRVQVFAVVLEGVEATPELLSELNDLNGGTGFARVFHVGGQVLVEVELLVATLDLAELDNAFTIVAGLVNDIGPLLAAVFAEVSPES